MIRKAAADAGRPAPRIVAGLPVAVHDDVAEARAAAARLYQAYGELPNYQRILARGGITGPAEAVIVGDEDSVAAQVRALFAAGATDSGRPRSRSATTRRPPGPAPGRCSATWPGTERWGGFTSTRRASRAEGGLCQAGKAGTGGLPARWGTSTGAGSAPLACSFTSPTPPTRRRSLVLVQRRARWAHQGGTWALPGGAMDSDETPAEAALREADEECMLDPKLVVPRGRYSDDHGGWAYHTVLAQAAEPLRVRADAYESDEAVWLPAGEVDQLDLHPGFAATWPALRQALLPLTVLVDGTSALARNRTRRPDRHARHGRGCTSS